MKKKRPPSMWSPATRKAMEARRVEVTAKLTEVGNLKTFTPEEVQRFAEARGEKSASAEVLAESYRKAVE